MGSAAWRSEVSNMVRPLSDLLIEWLIGCPVIDLLIEGLIDGRDARLANVITVFMRALEREQIELVCYC